MIEFDVGGLAARGDIKVTLNCVHDKVGWVTCFMIYGINRPCWALFDFSMCIASQVSLLDHAALGSDVIFSFWVHSTLMGEDYNAGKMHSFPQ